MQTKSKLIILVSSLALIVAISWVLAAGTVNIVKDSAVANQTVFIGASNITLGQWKVKSTEATDATFYIRRVSTYPIPTDKTQLPLANLGIYQNGNKITDESNKISGFDNKTFTLSLTANTDVIIALKGDINNSIYAKGEWKFSLLYQSGGKWINETQGQNVSVQTPYLTLSLDPSVGDATYNLGDTGKIFGQWLVKSNNNITAKLSLKKLAGFNNGNNLAINNLKIKVDGTEITPAPSNDYISFSAYTFNVNLTSTNKTISLIADPPANTYSGTWQFSLIAAEANNPTIKAERAGQHFNVIGPLIYDWKDSAYLDSAYYEWTTEPVILGSWALTSIKPWNTVIRFNRKASVSSGNNLQLSNIELWVDNAKKADWPNTINGFDTTSQTVAISNDSQTIVQIRAKVSSASRGKWQFTLLADNAKADGQNFYIGGVAYSLFSDPWLKDEKITYATSGTQTSVTLGKWYLGTNVNNTAVLHVGCNNNLRNVIALPFSLIHLWVDGVDKGVVPNSIDKFKDFSVNKFTANLTGNKRSKIELKANVPFGYSYSSSISWQFYIQVDDQSGLKGTKASGRKTSYTR